MKTDFEKVTDKLLEVGAVLINHTIIFNAKDEFSSSMKVNFWQVNQKGLIVCGYENGGAGYVTIFVGLDNAPVESDLEFIEAYAAEPYEEFESNCPTCNEIVCFLHCQSCGDAYGECSCDEL